MIDLYSGTPGSGKSLHSSEKIYYALKYKRPVIANFEINDTKIKKRAEFIYLPNDELNPEYLKDYARKYWKGKRIKEDHILLIIDEAQLLFNAREWSKPDRKEWLSFFTQHRKFGYHIIMVAQFDNMIDKQIRSLIEYQYVHRKVSNFGLMGKIMSTFCLGKLFVAVRVWYPLNEKIDSEFFTARKKYYSLYDTYLILDEEEEDRPKLEVSSRSA